MSAPEMGLRNGHGRRIGRRAGAFCPERASQAFYFESLGVQARLRLLWAEVP